MNWVAAFILTDEKPKFSIHVIHPTSFAKVLFVATVIFIWLPFLILTSHIIMKDKRQLKWWIVHKSFWCPICKYAHDPPQTRKLVPQQQMGQWGSNAPRAGKSWAVFDWVRPDFFSGCGWVSVLCKIMQATPTSGYHLGFKEIHKLRILPKQNTALLSTVCVFVHWREISDQTRPRNGG